MFGWLRRHPDKTGSGQLTMSWTEGGLEYRTVGDPVPPLAGDWLRDPDLFADWERVACLAQIEAEGYAVIHGDTLILGWGEVYPLLALPEYSGCQTLLGLPPFLTLRPALVTHGSLSDPGFEIAFEWRGQDGRPLAGSVSRTGAIVRLQNRESLLTEPVWRLAVAVREFARRESDQHHQLAQERAWGQIRRLALAANGILDRFLERTIVLTIANLDLGLRRTEVESTTVVEVLPRVPGAPEQAWLETFDGYQSVQEHYDLPTADGGRIRVILEPDARQVLTEIKRMPGRRVSGQRAEAFLRNPYALLGEAMARVVPPEQFEAARESAGVCFYDFHTDIQREPDGRVRSVRLALEATDPEVAPLPALELADKATVQGFVSALAAGIDQRVPCFHWGRHTLELRGDAEERLARLRAVLGEPWTGETLLQYAVLHDLSRYSPRVQGIGAHKPQYVPYIAQKDGKGGWLPENLEPVVEYQPPEGDPVLVPVSDEARAALKQWLDTNPTHDATINLPGWPGPVKATDARLLDETFERAFAEASSAQEDATEIKDSKVPVQPEANSSPEATDTARQRLTLNIAQNVDQIDYIEKRAQQLAFDESTPPELPVWLQPSVILKHHQHIGLGWLQHLWCCEDRGVRGALLADDMGLGKTLQLLAFIAGYLEPTGQQADPVLVVAPVSLLENWRAEIDKFFDHALGRQVLLLYGRELGQLKLKANEIDNALRQEGICAHLRPGWLGTSKLVLTTYETLRDLEFSFAEIRWSIMVCDEAQKIKTPGALMTHAAKAQNARFKIACTGTPVENSLADLWCLFDFIQPGLLGSLSQFCRSYRRPIEAQTDEQREKLEELRQLIEPQVLRRLKVEVAELPDKHINPDCRTLPLSDYQHRLYRNIATQFREQDEHSKAGALLLGMLHRLRSICADPLEAGTQPDLGCTLKEHRQRSPKLNWLVRHMEDIRRHEEKVILFTEFRDLQRLLQHRIRQHFGFSPAIVNGSTKAGNDAGERSRQALIDAFQSQPGFGVIILSTTAIGFGVNIQAANHVIHFTRPWNPAKEDQATDRAYRIGQTRPVHVYYPTVVANDFVTFEAKLDALLEAKRRLASDMLNGASDLDMSDWSGLTGPDGEQVIPRTRLSAEHLERLEPRVFERLCQLWLSRQGYTTYLTPGSGDGGVDVVGMRGSKGILIQCKSSAGLGRALGWEAVRDVVAGAAAYRAQHPAIHFSLMAATNQRFNTEAMRQAALQEVQLIDQAVWVKWLASNSIYLEEMVD